MSIDLSRVTGISDSRGVITEIKDSLGRVIWSAGGKPAKLLVSKVTATTVAGETEYPSESFILLNIYPKKNGTVKVSYGDLTKTVTDTSGVDEPNAIPVFFGTFNGVSDSVATPDSGELKISGAYRGYGRGSYTSKLNNKTSISYCACIKGVNDFGEPVVITDEAFRTISEFAPTKLPDSLTEIGNMAFSGTSLSIAALPSGLKIIGANAFMGCTAFTITDTTLPDSLEVIGTDAFYKCADIVLTSLPAKLKEIGNNVFRDRPNVNVRNLPSSLETVGAEAFATTRTSDAEIAELKMYNTVITFPSTIKSIGSGVFNTRKETLIGGARYYSYIAGVRMLATTPPTIETSAFGDRGWTVAPTTNNVITITVPKGCGEAYKAAWTGYKNYIVEES